MAPHSSTLAWKISWMEEPGRLQSMGSLELDRTKQLHFDVSLSCIGEGNGNLLQCSCLENPRDRGALWASICGVAQSRAWLKRLSSSSSRLAITFLPRSKRLLISWLQSPSAAILEPQKIKSDTVSTVSPSIYHEVMWPDAMIFFWMLSFKPSFSLSSFTFIKRLLVPLHFLLWQGFVICISEIIDIPPSNLDSSLCFLQPSVSHDVLCI